jgi:hypothetical protein
MLSRYVSVDCDCFTFFQEFVAKGDPRPFEDLDTPIRLQFYFRDSTPDPKLMDLKLYLPLDIFERSGDASVHALLTFFENSVVDMTNKLKGTEMIDSNNDWRRKKKKK